MAPKKEGRTRAPAKLSSSVAMATRAWIAWASREASGASRGATAVASHAAAASFRSIRSGADVSRPAAPVSSGQFGFLFLSGGAAAASAWYTQPSGGLSFCSLSQDQNQTETRPCLSDASTEPLDDGDPFVDNDCSFDDNVPLEGRRVAVTSKDVESDDAIWALYERWCKIFNKKRDNLVEKSLRFDIFRDVAMRVFNWNTYVPDDPEEAAIFLERKRKAAAGEDTEDDEEVHLTDDWYQDMFLGIGADGGDPAEPLFWGYWDNESIEN